MARWSKEEKNPSWLHFWLGASSPCSASSAMAAEAVSASTPAPNPAAAAVWPQPWEFPAASAWLCTPAWDKPAVIPGGVCAVDRVRARDRDEEQGGAGTCGQAVETHRGPVERRPQEQTPRGGHMGLEIGNISMLGVPAPAGWIQPRWSASHSGWPAPSSLPRSALQPLLSSTWLHPKMRMCRVRATMSVRIVFGGGLGHVHPERRGSV